MMMNEGPQRRGIRMVARMVGTTCMAVWFQFPIIGGESSKDHAWDGTSRMCILTTVGSMCNRLTL